MRNAAVVPSLLVLTLLASNSLGSQQLFGQLDQNQDGWLDASEIETKHQRLFKRLLRTSDDDQDGRLSSDEFLAGLQPQQPAKPLEKKQGSEAPGADALLVLLARMDTNTNGRIEAEEVPGPFRGIFDRIEERLGGEPDGVLDQRELTMAGPRLSQIALRITERMGLDVEVEMALLSDKQWQSVLNMTGRRGRRQMLADPKQAREIFKQFDANGDGQVALEEVPEQIADRFEQLLDRADRNGDEQISEQELMAVSRMMRAMAENQPSPQELASGVKRILRQLDRDGDGAVSRDEAPRRMADRFDRLDENGSGKLEREELGRIVQLLRSLRRTEGRLRADADSMMESEN